MKWFAQQLVAWQQEQGRHDLPWQCGRNPYHIWLSEIMLQQTRVETAIPYFQRFVAHFPELSCLAEASQEEVLALWSGLGYYARARNLRRAAQQIMTQWGGLFPRQQQDIEALPGVGRSTAAAIGVFAFGQRAAILDGNVRRVLCRAYGVEGFPGDKKVEARLWALAEALLPARACDRYIQAQMDLGALLCTRSSPGCCQCPLQARCVARQDGRCEELPHKRSRRSLPYRQTIMMVVLHENKVLLQQRPQQGIWGGLLSLPEVVPGMHAAQHWLKEHLGLGRRGRRLRALLPFRHVFTHFSLGIEPWCVEVDVASPLPVGSDLQWMALEQALKAGIPAPVRRILAPLLATA